MSLQTDLDDAPAPGAATVGRTPHPTAPSPAEEAEAAWRTVRTALRVASRLMWLGFFSLYVKVWIEPQWAKGNLEGWAKPVADGTAAAPFQYRFLVPDVLVWLHDHLGWDVGFAAQVVDGACLAVGVLLLERLLRHLDLEDWLVPVAALGGFLGLGVLWWGKFETMAAFAATTAAVLALARAGAHRGAVLAVASIVLIGTRTDLLIALGVAYLAAWWWGGRDRSDAATGIALGVLGLGATVVLARIYPDARYDAATGVVQLAHNVRPAVWLTAAGFLAPALAPYLLAVRVPALRRALRPHLALVAPLLTLVGVELASVAAIGRLEEVRLFFPLTAPLAVLAVVGWRAALSLRAPTAPAAGAPAAA